MVMTVLSLSMATMVTTALAMAKGYCNHASDGYIAQLYQG